MWLLCLLLGHKYRVWRSYSSEVRRVWCPRCKRHWGMNDRVRTIIPWDNELGELHGDYT